MDMVSGTWTQCIGQIRIPRASGSKHDYDLHVTVTLMGATFKSPGVSGDLSTANAFSIHWLFVVGDLESDDWTPSPNFFYSPQIKPDEQIIADFDGVLFWELATARPTESPTLPCRTLGETCDDADLLCCEPQLLCQTNCCYKINSPCNDDSECCTGMICKQKGGAKKCVIGKRRTCARAEAKCPKPLPCCSGLACQKRKEDSPRKCCSKAGTICKKAKTCCKGLACQKKNRKSHKKCCGKAGTKCKNAKTCCKGLGCQKKHQDSPKKCCSRKGAKCKNSLTCCKGLMCKQKGKKKCLP